MKMGEWLDGRYRILRELGEGGQGSVYLAIQEKIYKFYAVKIVEKRENNFSRESVELWKRLSHPGLPEIIDIVETEQNICLVMEYVEGKTLKEEIEKNGMPGERKVICWSIQICEILEYLHGQNPPIIFGDMKLSNLILQKERIVMVDLGSAVLHSSRGMQSGTPEYLPPREVRWEAKTERDIYALGKCMEALLSGFGRESSQMRKIRKKCMAVDAGERYPDIQSCRQDLEKLQNRPWMLAIMILLTVCVMGLASETMKKERLEVAASAQYMRLMEKAADSTIEDQRRIFQEAITVDPACENGYLQLLENYLEDSCLTVEEERDFRKILVESQGDGVCFEELLRENEKGYAQVAWETAMAYWYFYEGEGGRSYAFQWFEKLLSLSEEAAGDENRRAQIKIYAKIGSYRQELEHGERTGETEVKFDVYWSDLMELFQLSRKQENSMLKISFWQELVLQMEHYQFEFLQAGIEEEKMKKIKQEIEKNTGEIVAENKAVRQKKEELMHLLTETGEELQ